MKVLVPKYFTYPNLPKFLSDISPYFGYIKKEEEGFILDVSNIKSISLFGQLLLYKFVSFTAENKCFRGPTIHGLYENPLLRVELTKSGFWQIIITYVNNPDNQRAITKSYQNLKPSIQNDFILAPLKLLRTETTSRSHLENEYFSKIFSFYDTSKASTICFCLGELLTNFWSHAKEDTGTIMVAKGNRDSIDIFFADTGEGIINSFIVSDSKYKRYNKSSIMQLAIEKNITSKPNTSHLGMGLYMINCIAQNNKNSIFRIISDEVEYTQTHNKSGVVKKVPFWKGTITYLHLDIKTLLSLNEIKELYTSTIEKLQFI